MTSARLAKAVCLEIVFRWQDPIYDFLFFVMLFVIGPNDTRCFKRRPSGVSIYKILKCLFFIAPTLETHDVNKSNSVSIYCCEGFCNYEYSAKEFKCFTLFLGLLTQSF